MSVIVKMSEQLTNLIAAGEVVERPMGVVKELVENAIDAGAKDIEVRIEDGGLKKIEVIDQGCGMDKADAVNALQRHATSKIHKTEDLWDISTLGFRGEALPSIASVSKFALLTNDGTDSTEIRVNYGKLDYAGPKAAPKGTIVRVEGLFYHTPARLKHLKSVLAETSAVIELLERFAFAKPDIAFRLYSNEILRLETKGNSDLPEIMYRIYGRETAEGVIEAAFQDYDFTIQALLARPAVNRAANRYIEVFINDRIVRDYLIQKAVISAYAPFLPEDRYPICILKIKTDPQLVDVNVHPSKWEVRISKEKQLITLIENQVTALLRENIRPKEFIYKPGQSTEAGGRASAGEALGLREIVESEQKDRHGGEPFGKISAESSEAAEQKAGYFVESKQKITDQAEQKPEQASLELDKSNVKFELGEAAADSAVEPANYPEGASSAKRLPALRVIGQLRGDYILAEGDEGLYVIDQHAAEERVNFERITKAVADKSAALQQLAVPLLIDLTPAQFVNLDQYRLALAAIGLKLEPFGGNTIVCKEIPVWMAEIDQAAAVREIIDCFDPDRRLTDAEFRKQAIATMACHSSVRFNHYLTMPEMEKILKDLASCAQPYHCPHGRPTIISISDRLLRKEFGRG